MKTTTDRFCCMWVQWEKNSWRFVKLHISWLAFVKWSKVGYPKIFKKIVKYHVESIKACMGSKNSVLEVRIVIWNRLTMWLQLFPQRINIWDSYQLSWSSFIRSVCEWRGGVTRRKKLFTFHLKILNERERSPKKQKIHSDRRSWEKKDGQKNYYPFSWRAIHQEKILSLTRVCLVFWIFLPLFSFLQKNFFLPTGGISEHYAVLYLASSFFFSPSFFAFHFLIRVQRKELVFR